MYSFGKDGFIPVYAVNLWQGSWVHWLVSFAPDGGVWSSSHPDHFTPWKRDPVTHLMETRWAQSRSGCFGEETVPWLCWFVQPIAYSQHSVCCPSWYDVIRCDKTANVWKLCWLQCLFWCPSVLCVWGSEPMCAHTHILWVCFLLQSILGHGHSAVAAALPVHIS